MRTSTVVGYLIGSLMVVVGILMIAGWLGDRGFFAEQTLARTMFGVILVLYGVYRLSVTQAARKRGEIENRTGRP